MTLIYGEGIKAFQRLQMEILRSQGDESVFAWSYGTEKEAVGLFAKSFRDFRDIQLSQPRIKQHGAAYSFIINGGIHFKAEVIVSGSRGLWSKYVGQRIESKAHEFYITLNLTEGVLNPDQICLQFYVAGSEPLKPVDGRYNTVNFARKHSSVKMKRSLLEEGAFKLPKLVDLLFRDMSLEQTVAGATRR